MKADMIEYIKALSDKNYELIEEIVVKKYKKFINFFELVRDYGDDITNLKYNLSDDNILDVTITMKNNIKKSIKKEMVNELEKIGYIIDVDIKKRKLNIKITYTE